MTVKLAVDVFCDWLGYEPAYRVYVDSDLLTERNYIWDNRHQYVREILTVNLAPGQHTIKIEPVRAPGTQATFKMANFAVNDLPAELHDNTFTI